MAAIAGAAGMSPSGIAFQGPRWSLVGLLMKNLFFTVFTAGMYRFWAKTRIRQYFWGNIQVEGEPLEYVGRGMELFIGFLIAIAILVPIGLVYSGLQLMLVGAPGWMAIAVNAVYYVALLFLVQVAIYRARRYRLTRTAWRGIRCGLDGKSLRFALVGMGHTVLMTLTLGASYPWRRVALTRLLTDNMRFGNQHFAFSGKGRDLFKAWVPTMIANLGIVLPIIWLAVGFGPIMAIVETQPVVAGERIEALMTAPATIAAFVAMAVFTVVGAVCYVFYRVREFNYITSHTRLGATGFAAALKTRRVFWLYMFYWLAVAIGAIVAVAAIGFAATIAPVGEETMSMIAGFGLVAVAALLLPIAKLAWLDFGLLREACRSLAIENPGAVQSIVQDSHDTPRFGEGLADAFDVGGV